MSETNMSEAELKQFREISKRIGYGVWKYNFSSAHPDATNEERAKAWDEARESQVKAGKRALRALEKDGYKIVKSD